MKYLDLDGLSLYDSNMKQYLQSRISESNNVAEFQNYLEFPTIGKSRTIYIDKEKDMIYRWDETNLKYYSLNDYNNIGIIDGCC